MMMRLDGLIMVALFGSVALLACSKDSDNGYVRPKGRGSTACQAWQKSFCDFVAVDCKALAEAECVDTYYGVTCRSDEAAQSCAATLDKAVCGSVPSGCNVTDIADPEPATSACNSYVNAVCEREAECGGSAAEECIANAQSEIDCSKAVAYGTTYETCISEVAELACSAAALPETCSDVIKLMQ